MAPSFEEKTEGKSSSRSSDVEVVEVSGVRQDDDRLLAKLGYKGEFKREFSLIETIAFAYAIMGVIGGVSSTFSFVLVAGGHVGMVWGWIIPCCFVMTIALCLAELASSMPTSAGLYYFSAKLAPAEYSALASWITGWANITGQVTLVCSIDYTVAQEIVTALIVGTDGRVTLGTGPTYGILLALLLVHGLICSCGTRLLARLNLLYGALNFCTTIAVIAIFFVHSKKTDVSAHQAFTMYENSTGWQNNAWAFCLSFLASMWTLTGDDSAAHVSEETAGAARNAPIAIISSVSLTAITGWIILISASFATASVSDILASPLPMPFGQLLLDAMGKKGMLAVWSLILTVLFMAGAAQCVDASRVVYAFARDNALPGSRYWKRVNRHTQTPVNATWLVVILAGLCGLVGFSSTALTSLAGASTIGLYISYATPIFLRITSGRDKLKPGPFSLGRYAVPLGAVAVSWVAFITVVLMFPGGNNPTAISMNYAVVFIAGVLVLAGIWWVIDARKWFKGPVPNIGKVDSY
ncbi:hypothetical protein JAAARDRAFT_184077 [Jaapia argillacea MUCL 33604]|uniref:Amino acid permease/ SLC12A domain-containing protein n=1 Tax=Jaapia argillacea MUCL 33604 TaxID=933084 RepID=A0A067PC80_9AGAM|nr:hypothetical protein JAAARDRAFT_184077 [Jaapia argillacea MUCL 33604]